MTFTKHFLMTAALVIGATQAHAADPKATIADLDAAASAPGLNAVVVGPVSRAAEAVLHRQLREALA